MFDTCIVFDYEKEFTKRESASLKLDQMLHIVACDLIWNPHHSLCLTPVRIEFIILSEDFRQDGCFRIIEIVTVICACMLKK